MRNLLTIIFLTFSLICSGQDQSQQMIKKTAQKVKILNSNIFYKLATLHSFEIGTLIVIPEITEEGNGYITFNSNIILIEDKTGEVKAKFSGKKDWFIDAVSIDEIEIEPKLYQLNKTTVAFGLKLFYSNQSRPSPYSSTQLSLYALEGNKLKLVLNGFPVKTFNGETDTTCRGEFEEHSKKIQVLDTYSNEYADLKFTDKIEISERNADCEKIRELSLKEFETLKYENGKYKNVL